MNHWIALLLSAPLMVLAGEEPAAAAAPETAAAEAAVPEKYYVEDIKAAMMAFIAERADEHGVFRIHDSKTDETLELKFVEIHDPVRRIGRNTYFACTDFHVVGDEKKLYDLDFWMDPKTACSRSTTRRFTRNRAARCSMAGTSSRATPSSMIAWYPFTETAVPGPIP